MWKSRPDGMQAFILRRSLLAYRHWPDPTANIAAREGRSAGKHGANPQAEGVAESTQPGAASIPRVMSTYIVDGQCLTQHAVGIVHAA